MKKNVRCLSCGKNVVVELVEFGNGMVAVCPVCGQVAYNSDKRQRFTGNRVFKTGKRLI